LAFFFAEKGGVSYVEITCVICAKQARKKTGRLGLYPGHCRTCGAKEYYRARDKLPSRKARTKELFTEAKRRRSNARATAWYKENRERMLANVQAWRVANPERRSVERQARRARKRAALGSHTAEEWKALVARHRGRCIDCGKAGKMTVGHLVPLSKGGSNFIGNLKPQCGSCNSKQATKVHPLAVLSLFDRMV
jgi:5-methylcytosine-specific restriction endonuclease McrA